MAGVDLLLVTTALCTGLALMQGKAAAQTQIQAQAQIQAQTGSQTQAAQISFSVPAGPLNSALATFGRQAGVQVTYLASVASGKTSAGFTGKASREQALAAILSGSGLVYSFPNATTAAISAPATGGASADGATVLDKVTLEGQGGTTEGTGSYTTGEMSTATGMPLSIRETPQSVTVVTRQRMNDQVLNTTADILRTAPGIQIQEWDSQRSEPYSRGFYLNSFQYDGVALNNLIAMYGEHRSDTLQYDRVEVLRGANGMLTGNGNPSGAVNFVRKHADSKVLTGEVSSTAGSWDNYRETLDSTAPLNSDGSVRGRLIVSRNDAGSHLDRQSTESGLFYGIIDADLGPNTKFSIGGEYQHRDINNAIWGGVPIFFSDGTRTNFSRSLNTAPDWAYWNTENTTVFSSLEHRFDNDWALKVDAVHVHKKGDAKLLYLWGQPDPVTGLGLDPSSSKFDHDAVQTVLSAKLNGSFDLFGRTHELFSGMTADWMDEDYVYQSGLSPAAFGNIFDFDGTYPEPEWADGRLRVSRIDQFGAYAGTRVNVTDDLKVIGGARFSHVETETVRTWSGVRAARVENNVSPYFGVTYDLSSNLTAYASYADVFRVQTERDINDQFLDAVTGSNIETGIKGSWFDERLNASIAVFRAMEDNVAIATSQYIPGTSSLAYTAGQGVETKGFEAEISGELMHGWNVSLGATVLESKDADGNDVNTQLPRQIVRMFTTYTLPGEWEKLTIGGGVNWQGTTYLPIETVNGTVRYSQPPYATVSLMARYKINETLSAQLNVDNVFDKRYVHMMEGDEQITFGTPRSAYFRLSAKF
jgi:outer membrane receptor for ferric coprogen and ferric-rhodotorulic acid